MENAVFFTRQSGESAEGNEQQSLDEQVRLIEAYANRMDLRIVDRVAEIGISANEMFDRVVRYLQEHPEVHTIITYSSDRLARSLNDVAALLRIRKAGRMSIRSCAGFEANHARKGGSNDGK